ncbi:MAG: XdhC family protein, partial [Elusimicrobiota bacterium]|jgi:xanthine dehydrogenase accessory factor
VADEREEFANRERFPQASRILVERPDRAVKSADVDAKTYVIIVTRGHALDHECLAAALKTRAAYIGMIGSRSKVPSAFRALNRKGLHPEKDKRVFAPIGLDCGGKSPGAIAISVLAEVLAVHNGRTGRHMRLA